MLSSGLLASEETQANVSTKLEAAIEDLRLKYERIAAEKEAAAAAAAAAAAVDARAAAETAAENDWSLGDADPELEGLRQARMAALRGAAASRRGGREAGHGSLREITEVRRARTHAAAAAARRGAAPRRARPGPQTQLHWCRASHAHTRLPCAPPFFRRIFSRRSRRPSERPCMRARSPADQAPRARHESPPPLHAPPPSPRSLVVMHFFHPEFETCKVMDKHLRELAARALQTKFLAVSAPKAAFFVAKLKVRTLPTLIFFVDGVAVGRQVGYEGLRITVAPPPAGAAARAAAGGATAAASTDFSTASLARALRRAGVFGTAPIIGALDEEADVADDDGDEEAAGDSRRIVGGGAGAGAGSSGSAMQGAADAAADLARARRRMLEEMAGETV